MTETPDPTQPTTPAAPPADQATPPATPAYAAAPPANAAPQSGQVGKVRGTGMCILLLIVTLGFYSLYWFYSTHEEMKRHSGQGLGGVVALLLGLFVGFVMPYLTSNEVGGLYERQGKPKPVSAATGLWYFPGMLILIGPIVWFVKTNGALNDYWKSMGAPAS
ncbi:DUF4234 domain-containing protein [Nocardioides dilutus]